MQRYVKLNPEFYKGGNGIETATELQTLKKRYSILQINAEKIKATSELARFYQNLLLHMKKQYVL